jgi:hypothetical protein
MKVRSSIDLRCLKSAIFVTTISGYRKPRLLAFSNNGNEEFETCHGAFHDFGVSYECPRGSCEAPDVRTL